MLSELRIRDFAIIADISLSLAPGFNVLSGETGAGKSIVVVSLGLLLGERASADQVRSGAERAVIEGIFEPPHPPAVKALLLEHGLAGNEEDAIIMRRELGANGRGRAWVNDSAVTVATLAAIGRTLASIHGQHEAQSLLDPASQRDVLDAFGDCGALCATVRSLYHDARDIDARLEQMRRQIADAARRADYLRHVVKEIEGARLTPGEEERIEEEARRLEHADELASTATAASEMLTADESGALDALAHVRRKLDVLSRIDATAARLSEMLESAYVITAELARELDVYASGIEIDPQRLREVNERRDLIFRLTRKYGGSIPEVLLTLQSSREELSLAESGEESVASLERDRERVHQALSRAAAELSAQRTKAAARLQDVVSAMLPALGMVDGAVSIELNERRETGAHGAEDVQFNVRLNVGHEPRPLAKVASGGELSRIMLAFKSVLSAAEPVTTLVFDEVDAGIGGAVALRVGDALRALAESHQVLVITHLPQIASRAHHHLTVKKTVREGFTTADIEELRGDERVAEIARMLAGDESSSTGRKHARELLQTAARAR